jgi:hypothetical protein
MLRYFLALFFVAPLVHSATAQSTPVPPSISDLRKQAACVLALPAHFHASAEANELQVRLRNVVIDSTLLWLHLQLYNRSHIAFHPAYCRFIARDRSSSKRKAVQSVEIMPFRRPMLGVVWYHHRYDLLVPFIPFALVKPQQLVIEIGEIKSRRVLSLMIAAKDILHASYLP